MKAEDVTDRSNFFLHNRKRSKSIVWQRAITTHSTKKYVTPATNNIIFRIVDYL